VRRGVCDAILTSRSTSSTKKERSCNAKNHRKGRIGHRQGRIGHRQGRIGQIQGRIRHGLGRISDERCHCPTPTPLPATPYGQPSATHSASPAPRRNTTGQSTLRCPAQREITEAESGAPWRNAMALHPSSNTHGRSRQCRTCSRVFRRWDEHRS